MRPVSSATYPALRGRCADRSASNTHVALDPNAFDVSSGTASLASEPDRFRGLLIHGVRKTHSTHFTVEPPYTFASFSRDTKCAHPGDPGVACVATNVLRGRWVGHSRESSRAGDFDSVWEDFDPHMIATDTA